MDNISPDIIAKIRAEVERHDGPEYAKELLREIDRLIRLVKATAPPLEEPRCIGHNSQGPVLGCIDCHAAALDRIRAAPAPPPQRKMADGPIHTYWHRRRDADPLHGKITGCLCEACQNERGYQVIGASAPTPELKEVMCNFHRYAIETVCLDCKALRAKKSDAKTT